MKKLTTIELLNKLKIESLKGDNQELINKLAVELANRIYISNKKQTYKDLLDQLGYKEINTKHRKFIKDRFNKRY
jgi:hypothetical protein